jgi:hypothetical protein
MPRRGAHPLSAGERIAAAVVTGPLGHLYAGLADWAVLLARLAWARARAWARRAASPTR